MSVRIHAAWAAGSTVVLTGSRFLLLAILARRLDQSTLGLFAYTQWMIDIGFLLVTFGINGAAARYLAEYRSNANLIYAFARTWRLPSLLLPAVGALVATLGVSRTSPDIGVNGLGALALWALFAGLWAMQTSALMGLQQFGIVFFANLLAAAVMVLGAIFAPISAASPAGPFLLMAAGCAIAFAVGLFPLHRLTLPVNGPVAVLDRPSILRYSFNVWVTALLWSLVWSRGELPLVRHYLGDESLAQYSVVLSLVGGAIAGVMLGVGGIAPQVTRLLGDAKEIDAVRLCRKVGDWQLLISGSAAALLIWLAPEFLRIAFGSNYVSAAQGLSLLAVGLPALSFSMHNHFLQIKTGARFNRNTTLFGLVVLVVGAIILIPRFGIEGAALARVVALISLAFISAAVFLSRADASGVNRLGFLMVILVIGASAATSILMPELPLLIRGVLALATPGALVLLIRDMNGRLVIRSMAPAILGP